MDLELKELIEKATINGSISDENKNYIIEKASKLGVSEIEAKIYIDAALKSNKKNDLKIDFEKIDFNSINWIDKLSYAIGAIIILSGFLPWIEGHASSNFGFSTGASFNGGAGIFYSLPFGLGALYFVYNLSLKKFRKFYGLGLALFSLMLAMSYTTDYSSSYGGFSASAGTGPGPGLILMLIMGIVYSVVNFPFLSTIKINKQSLEKIETFSISNDNLKSLIKPLTIALLLFFWTCTVLISQRDKSMYFLLILLVLIALIVYRKKIVFEKHYVVLFGIILIDSFLNSFNLISKFGVQNQTITDINNLYSNNLTTGNYVDVNKILNLHGAKYFNLVIDENLLNFQLFIDYSYILCVIAAVIILSYKLLIIINEFLKNNQIQKTTDFISNHYKKLIWLLIILIPMNLGFNIYGNIKNKSDFQNEINKLENQPIKSESPAAIDEIIDTIQNNLEEINSASFDLIGQWTEDPSTCGDETLNQDNLFIEIDKDNVRHIEYGLVDANSNAITYNIGGYEYSGVIVNFTNNSFEVKGFTEGEEFYSNYSYKLENNKLIVAFESGAKIIGDNKELIKCE
jgi:hypothetical protein